LLQSDINLLVSIAAEVGILIHNSQLRKEKRGLEDKSLGLERQLGQSRKVLAEIMENASDGIIVTDRDGIILDANKAACAIYGYDLGTFIGMKIDELDADPVGAALQRERVLQGEPQVFEAIRHERGGKRIQIEVSAKAIDIGGATYIHHFERDVTERKRIEALLMQSQKMESIGVLAGGIAHDLNNVITPVVAYSEVLLVKHSAELSDAVRDRIILIQKAGERATGIIKKLLSFSRISPSTMEQVNINAVVKESMALLEQHMDRNGVTLKLMLKEPLSLIAGAATELQQVLMNLVVNAVDAMPGGGTLTVRTRDVKLGDEARRIHPMLMPGRYVVLSVADTGHGIPKELRQKIFEPFFTTKGVGKGTGLGLAMSYSIVKEHRGVITVMSEPGRGSTFEIYLPLGATGELAMLHDVRRDSMLYTDMNRPDRVKSEL
jgi:PAS domain S-box-containing protein